MSSSHLPRTRKKNDSIRCQSVVWSHDLRIFWFIFTNGLRSLTALSAGRDLHLSPGPLLRWEFIGERNALARILTPLINRDYVYAQHTPNVTEDLSRGSRQGGGGGWKFINHKGEGARERAENKFIIVLCHVMEKFAFQRPRTPQFRALSCYRSFKRVVKERNSVNKFTRIESRWRCCFFVERESEREHKPHASDSINRKSERIARSNEVLHALTTIQHAHTHFTLGEMALSSIFREREWLADKIE